MNPSDNQGYKTNETVGKMFLHSCLGKLVIFAVILLVLFVIAVLTKPTDQEMRDEMNDNIMQCMEQNDSIRGDQIDDFVNNIGFIFTKADTTKVGKEWREVFDKYNRLEIFNHSFFRTAYVYNNVKTEGTRVGTTRSSSRPQPSEATWARTPTSRSSTTSVTPTIDKVTDKNIIQGFRIGIPIALGYFAVAFSLGIIARQAGLTAAIGFVSSFFTRASAGEYGVYTLVAAQAAYAEIVAMCLVVNLRYMLMSAALSQKIAPGTSWFHRILMACCVTDEVFGVSIAHPGYCPPAYTYSAALISTLFWASGCAAGIIAGGMLPTNIVAALSVALYGMFLAIIMPPARDDRHVLYAVAASFALSGACAVAPVVSSWSSGTRTIVLTILISAVAAWLKPVKTEEEADGQA